MNEPQEIYQELWDQSRKKFLRNEFELDTLIDNPHDLRRGITCLVRFNDSVTSSVESFIKDAKLIEPNQYYYPKSDLHLTIMSIITCHEGFSLNSININDYISIIEECTSAIKPFKIHFKGITASPSCIMLQGFPHTDAINQARDYLRRRFKKSTLQCSIDSRYTIKTAHSTIIRFRKPVSSHGKFLDFLNCCRELDFGTMDVNSFELVFNDWYQKSEKTKVLHRSLFNSCK